VIKPTDTIENCEEIFFEAAKLAKSLRSKAIVKNKANSGIGEIDIVTSADLAVQEFILQKLAATSLVNCEVVAEEQTESKKLFSKSADHVLTIDPIDGTKNYANGGRLYSVIVSIHDKKNPLYTFNYYPEIDWGIKIVGKKITYLGLGSVPTVSIPKKVIGWSNYKGTTNPKKTLGQKYEELIQDGYQFMTKQEIGQHMGCVLSFISGLTDGLFLQDVSAVDGLEGLHFGLANNYEILRDIDISKIAVSEITGAEEYQGHYLVIKE